VTPFLTKTEKDRREQQKQCLNLIVVLNNGKLKNYINMLLSSSFLFKSNENGQQQTQAV
jgi:hypothetical protein